MVTRLAQHTAHSVGARPVPLGQLGCRKLPSPRTFTSLSQRHILFSVQQPGNVRHSVATRAFNSGKGPDYGDRLFACLPYLLPLLDAFPFGKFIFMQMPFVARAMAPLGPLAALYNTIPFAPLIVFLVVYNGVVANMNMTRFVRFNAMQAVMLDVLLIIPQVLMGTLFRNPGNDDLSLQLYINTYNTIFLFVAISVAYGMGSALVGQTARLPLVAEAAETQVGGRGPF